MLKTNFNLKSLKMWTLWSRPKDTWNLPSIITIQSTSISTLRRLSILSSLYNFKNNPSNFSSRSETATCKRPSFRSNWRRSNQDSPIYRRKTLFQLLIQPKWRTKSPKWARKLKLNTKMRSNFNNHWNSSRRRRQCSKRMLPAWPKLKSLNSNRSKLYRSNWLSLRLRSSNCPRTWLKIRLILRNLPNLSLRLSWNLNLKRSIAPHSCTYIVSTIGMWGHSTCPTKLCLCFDDFGMKYFSKYDA